MVHVKATDASIKYNIKIKELRRCASPGEEFDVSESRFETLSGSNQYHVIFVTKCEKEEPELEEEVVVKKKKTKKAEEEK